MEKKRFIVVGNWKSNGSVEFVREITKDLLNKLKFDQAKLEVLVAPMIIHVPSTKAMLKTHIQVCAQNVSAYPCGAFTGEVSAEQIKDFGINWVIIGHSERRTLFQETLEIVQKKVEKAQEQGLNSIVCIGETYDEREGGNTQEVIRNQLNAIKPAVKDWSKIVIAYEPLWAVGTGKTATPDMAQEIHEFIRKWITQNASDAISQSIRIIYGGSVTDQNTQSLIAQKDIDGVLVGGASLQSVFGQIVEISAVNPLTGFSEHGSKSQMMKDDYKSYMRQVQQEQALKPRNARQRNGTDNKDSNVDNAFIFDNQSTYDVPDGTKGKQRYENAFNAYSRGASRSSFDNQNRMKNSHTQSMPHLHLKGSQLTTIPEASKESGADGDVHYDHYMNNQNQKVNMMTIDRDQYGNGNDENQQRPETTMSRRPDTQNNFQNFNWNTQGQADYGNNRLPTAYIPPPTAALGKNLWDQGHQKERYLDAELRKTKYGDELKLQLQENEAKKRQDKLDDQVTDLHYLDESHEYNPFGRGGGGAPLRDQFGTMITSRKPQMRNEYAKNYAFNRGPKYSVMSSTRPMTKRAPTSYTSHYGVPRDLHTRNTNLGSIIANQGNRGGFIPPQTAMKYHGEGGAVGGQIPQVGGQQPAVQVVQQQPHVNVQQIVHPYPTYNPDYMAQVPQGITQGDYIVGGGGGDTAHIHPFAWSTLPNYYDWVNWYNQMQTLMHQDRLGREQEDMLRKKMLEEQEEKMRKERDNMESRYQNEYDKKFKNLMNLQEDQLKRQEEYWERRHEDELSSWQEMLRLRPYVDRIDNYDALRMTQGLVDHLQNSVRYELGKVKTDAAGNDLQIQKRINNLKSALKTNTN